MVNDRVRIEARLKRPFIVKIEISNNARFIDKVPRGISCISASSVPVETSCP